MHVVIPHTYTKEVARAKVAEALDRARPQLAGKARIGEERWEGDTLYFAFSTEGQSVSGTFIVGETSFELSATLPLMLRMFESRLEKMILEQSSKLLQ